MAKILRIYHSTSSVTGIGVIDHCVKVGDFNGVTDPLSGNSVLSAKPASSIPSIFARMIFFRMAFGGLVPSQYSVKSQSNISVYNTAISRCLDLLEIVFNKQDNLEVKHFSFTDQIAALRRSDDKHRRFADALRQQKEKFLYDVNDVYLFYLNHQLIGGTSKYSMVFTSPNWNPNNPVKSLLERDEQFRLFVYKYVKAHEASLAMGGIGTDEHEFYEYVNNCYNLDVVEIPSAYTINMLDSEYEVLKWPINGADRMISINYKGTHPINLYRRPQNKFTSDFFIQSTIYPEVDRDITPLVLSEGDHPGLYYYDNVLWDADTRFNQEDEHDPDHPEKKCMLPDCKAYTHPYLTEVDFLESSVLALPFGINENDYYSGIKLDDVYSAMIPVKPVYFKYFKRDDMIEGKSDNMKNWNWKWDKNTMVFTLRIPICDLGGIHKGYVEYNRNYRNHVCYLSNETLKTRLSLGVFPLLKECSDYWVMFGMESSSNYYKVDLQYYSFGNEKELSFSGPEKRSENNKSWYQKALSFDYIRLALCDKTMNSKVNAIVIPRFKDISNNGNHEYTYAIDFGTTNTHIAYCIDGGKPQSFDSEIIKQQVSYFNNLNGKGELELLQAREFIPHFEGKSSNYAFPIRTVVNSNDTVVGTEETTVLFKKTSIGFHYPNEKVLDKNCHYHSDLKWKFLTVADGVNDKNVEAFFEEVMMMIKTHWLLQDVDHNNLANYPKIVLTYPLAGKRGLGKTENGWVKAYDDVFGVNIGSNKVDKMEESLAPCIKRIKDAKANPAGGILNVDIGGGSTDVQYFAQTTEKTWNYYDSIKFAGDDLWGIGNENITEYLSRPNIDTNRFTELADKKLLKASIVIGGEPTNYSAIKLDDCKEKVNYLFRDEKHNFANVLCDYGDSDTSKCRLQMFLHYSAIVYHIAKWMKAKEMPIPRTISFSGLGSLYVKLLFANNNKNKELTDFTSSLLETYYGASTPDGFTLVFEEHPKNVTAEGAAMPRDGIATPTAVTYYGYDRNVPVLSKDIGLIKTEVLDSFDKFIEGFEACSKAAGNVVPSLSYDEKKNLRTKASDSFEAIATKHKENHKNSPTDELDESAFIWTLKDSLYQL